MTMDTLDLSRIVAPSLSLRRTGSATGDSLKHNPDPTCFHGLEPGSPEYYKAQAISIILDGPWVRILSGFSTLGISHYVNTLFAQSCQRILVAAPSKVQFRKAITGLPPIAKRRIEYVSPDSALYHSVKDFFLPVAKDLPLRSCMIQKWWIPHRRIHAIALTPSSPLPPRSTSFLWPQQTELKLIPGQHGLKRL